MHCTQKILSPKLRYTTAVTSRPPERSAHVDPTLIGYGPRVAEPGLGLITDYPWSAPYEDVKLKPK